MKENDYLTPTQVARMLMVSPVTVRAWAQRGQLKAQTTPGGHRRFRYADVQDFARRHQLSLHKQPDHELRLLIIDDDEALVRFLCEALQGTDTPLAIEVACDGFEAGRMIERFRPEVVLLDLMMPGLDGFEVCRHIKAAEHTRAIRVIAMTGFDSEENRERILSYGAECCLNKPFSPGQLLEALQRPDGHGDVA